MKKFLPLLLCLLVLITSAFAENAGQTASEASFIGTWIENDGYGTLILRADGTSHMLYYDDTVTECHWEATDDGGRFTDGQWLNSPMKLLDENTLSVANGWMVFTREGVLPATDPALLLDATPVGEEGAPFLGEWTLVSLIVEDTEYNPALFDMNLTLCFNADGTILTNDGTEDYITTWFVSYGSAVVEGDILTIREDGLLIYDSLDGTMIFAPVLPEIPEPEAAEHELTESEVAEPEVTESGITFTPVGEEGAAFLGTWTLEAIDAEGMTMNPALLGMSMTLTFTADGQVSFDDGLDTEITAWHVEDGAAVIEGAPLTLNEEGKLVMTDDGASMIFTQGEAAESDESSDADELMALLELLALLEEESFLPGEHQGYVGQWYLCYVATGGLTGDLRAMGVTGSLTLNEDYTGLLTGIADEDTSWYEDEEGVIRFGESGTPMYLLGDEFSPAGVFLQYGSANSGYMIFSQNEEAVWDPAAYELQPLAPEASVVSAPAAVGGEFRLGVKYVCSSYSAGGVTNDASILGAEYAVVFREDGLADFTMAGFTMADLGCTVAVDGTRTIHFGGNAIPCVPTENGLDMDYFGIIYHMVPAE